VSRHSFERLDLADEQVRRSYEQGFFTSFERVKSNRLVHTLWLWDFDSRRLRTRIPYEDQWVFGMRNAAGEVEAALAFNVAMTAFQSRAFDFAPPAETAGCFEVLTFFNPADRELEFKYRLWHESVRVLGQHGFHTGFATTAPRPLGLYRRIGWQLVQQAEIAGEQRFFLRYSITEDASKVRVRAGQRDTAA
jgi:hypothetical protein